MSIQVLIKVVSGRFGDAEYAELSRVLTWIRPGQSLVVGRSSKAEFAVATDVKMSGTHFRISCTDDRCWLNDLNSSNGTTVNDAPVAEIDLADGDLIGAGATVFHVRISGVGESATAKPQASGPARILEPSQSDEDSVVVTPAFTKLLKGGESREEVAPSPVDLRQTDSGSRMQVVLKIESGPFGDARFAELTRVLNWIGPGQSLKVGRHPYDADIAVTDDGRMSSQHFEISCDGRAAAIRDLKSTNGTTLNGEPIEFAVLKHGDVIVAGETRFSIRILGVQETEEPVSDEDKPGAGQDPPTGTDLEVTTAQPSGDETDSVTRIPISHSMRVVLKVKSGPFGEVTKDDLSRMLIWIQPGQAIVVGSSTIEAGLRVGNDESVDAQHFEVSCDGRVCRVKDLSSSSGTWVRGKRVAEAVVSDAELIKAGDSVIEVRIIGAPDPTEEQKNAGTVEAAESKPTKHIPPKVAPTAEILNTTPFQFAPTFGRVGFPGHSLTLIVKGTFKLMPGQTAQLFDEQEFPTGDHYDPADEDMQGSVLYESDFAPVKPQGDVVLKGTCHPAGNQPVSQCDVTLQVGPLSRTLRVFGNRHWQGSGTKVTASEPQPFSAMPIRYENSFGGPAYAANPCGKGHLVSSTADDDLRLLPNIEDPNQLITTPRNEPAPAGFGPLANTWQRRRQGLGTYDDHWLKTRWPWFAEDLQWTYFNPAPPDQRLEGYFVGDEDIVLRNLHPIHSEYRSRLPGFRVRCFLVEGDSGVSDSDKEFREVEMCADTVWIDSDSEKLILVWRGVGNIPSAAHPQLSQIFIAAEQVAAMPASLEECRMAWQRFLADREAERNSKPQEPGAVDDEPVDDAAVKEPPEDEYDRQAREAREKSEADLRAILVNAGIDPDNPPEYSEEDLEKAKAALREQGIEIPDDEQNEPEHDEEDDQWTRERVIEHLKDNRSLAGEDLSGLDLSEIDFSSVDCSETQLADCLLTSALLTNANLTKAVLSRANLSKARLQSVELADADFADANLDDADLSQAQAINTNFTKCSMRNVRMNQAVANDALLMDANLTGAILTNAEFPGADFSNCQLHDCSFHESNLTGATLIGAQGTRVNMSSANLTGLRAGIKCEFREGMFHNAIGPDSTWAGCDLTSADFSCVEMEAADFSGARLCGANLHAANMKYTRLAHVDLTDALLTQMNLFEGSLDSADLTQANLSGSNMYGAEFVNAVLEKTRLKGTNLKMTKLEGASVDG